MIGLLLRLNHQGSWLSPRIGVTQAPGLAAELLLLAAHLQWRKHPLPFLHQPVASPAI